METSVAADDSATVRSYYEARLDRLARENDALRRQIAELSTFRQLAYRDSLTGLHNRRYFDERLAEELSRYARSNGMTQVAVLAIDLDHLKSINDLAGHATGDAVLRWFGEFLSSRCRKTDIACRIGGDEFAVISPSTSLDNARALLDRLAEDLVQATGKPQLPFGMMVEASFGVAATPEGGTTAQQLVTSADNAMYDQKQQHKSDPRRRFTAA